MVWKSHYRLYGPNVYELAESFLDDGHHNLCNNDFAWHLKNNGCGRWLFLEMNLVFIGVMAASCGSELRGCYFWEVYNVLVLC